MWRFPHRSGVEARTQDKPPSDPTDYLRWITTDRMLADPLTKNMKDTLLQQVLDTNKWNFRQGSNDKEVKLRKSAYRRALKDIDTKLFVKPPKKDDENDEDFENDAPDPQEYTDDNEEFHDYAPESGNNYEEPDIADVD